MKSDVRRREGFTLVIASEEDGHRFGGIRESADQLATTVCRRLNISPQRLVWVEHNEYGERFPDDWYLVVFGWDWSRSTLSNSFRCPTTELEVADLMNPERRCGAGPLEGTDDARTGERRGLENVPREDSPIPSRQ